MGIHLFAWAAIVREYVVMLARLGRWVDYVGKNHWRFGFALTALIAIEVALISAAVLFQGASNSIH
jgi:hypothetical protein